MTLARRLLATAIVLGAFGCGSPAAPDSFASGGGTPSPTATDTVSTVVTLTNMERRRAGLSELRQNAQLTRAAQLQSDQMGATRTLDHVIPGTPYPQPQDRLAAANYIWEMYGENVATGQRSGNEVVAAWMNSAGHRANILNPHYTELGVGFATDSAGQPYYAQVFGRPAN